MELIFNEGRSDPCPLIICRKAPFYFFFFFVGFFAALDAVFLFLVAAGDGVLSSLTCAGTTIPEVMSLGT